MRQDHDIHEGHETHMGIDNQKAAAITPTVSMDHTGHEETFRKKFWVSLVLSIPVLLFSEGFQMLIGFSMPEFPFSRWIALVFSIIVFIYGGIPFIQMAVPEIKNRHPGMMTLITLAISVAFIYSAAALVLPGQMDFFWELVTLIDIMLLGHWVEMRSVRQASGALNELARLMPDEAERVKPDGTTEKIPVRQLGHGDLVLVRPGASIPADGEIIEGESSVNEAMITGESKPVDKKVEIRLLLARLTTTAHCVFALRLPAIRQHWRALCVWWSKPRCLKAERKSWQTKRQDGFSMSHWVLRRLLQSPGSLHEGLVWR